MFLSGDRQSDDTALRHSAIFAKYLSLMVRTRIRHVDAGEIHRVALQLSPRRPETCRQLSRSERSCGSLRKTTDDIFKPEEAGDCDSQTCADDLLITLDPFE